MRQLQPAISHHAQIPEPERINFDKLATFLKDSYNKQDISAEVEAFSPDKVSAINILQNTYDLVSAKNLRARLKRILKKLQSTDYEFSSEELSS